MKRFLWTSVILILAGTMVYAQQAGTPSSAQIKQGAQQYLNEVQTNSSQFESTLADLNAQNISNKDAAAFNQLKTEISKLETLINTEQAKIKAALDKNSKVSSQVLDRVQSLINQHKAKMAELEDFTSS